MEHGVLIACHQVARLYRKQPRLDGALGSSHDMGQVGGEAKQVIFVLLLLFLCLTSQVDTLAAHLAPQAPLFPTHLVAWSGKASSQA